MLGGRVHPGLRPASGSLVGLWHDVSIYLLEMFEQEMLMVWVCEDSWTGPDGAAGRGEAALGWSSPAEKEELVPLVLPLGICPLCV